MSTTSLSKVLVMGWIILSGWGCAAEVEDHVGQTKGTHGHDDHDDQGHGVEVSRGPKGGRLFEADGFQLELSLEEEDSPPTFVAWLYDGQGASGYVEEHADLIASIRKGKPLNEGRRIAESTMTAIMGRMSAYTGRELKYKWAMKSSKLDLAPLAYKFGDMPVAPVAVPGTTRLI